MWHKPETGNENPRGANQIPATKTALSQKRTGLFYVFRADELGGLGVSGIMSRGCLVAQQGGIGALLDLKDLVDFHVFEGFLEIRQFGQRAFVGDEFSLFLGDVGEQIGP